MDKWKLFVKLFVVAVLLFVFCFYGVMPQYTENYQASLIDKVKRINEIEGPKIVLVGNSNLVFGIQSEILEEKLGMPVVNMGLHGGVGNCFNEQAAKLNVNKGDIYIICHSNYSDDDKIKNPELAWVTIENHKELYSYIRKKDMWNMAKAYPSYLRKCIDQWAFSTGNLENEDPAYRRSSFNEYGDNISYRDKTVDGTDFSVVEVPEISDITVERINKLNAEIIEKQATLLIAAYPIAYANDAPGKEEYQVFTKILSDKMDCPVISEFSDYCLDPSYFFNTYLHLTNEGAKVRTELLAADIQRYLNNKEAY